MFNICYKRQCAVIVKRTRDLCINAKKFTLTINCLIILYDRRLVMLINSDISMPYIHINSIVQICTKIHIIHNANYTQIIKQITNKYYVKAYHYYVYE